ncbi:MAG: gliding motility lipoprotein GldH [Bacteroidetes bacterium]|nr:gliding motility lipoprotein GldH [Bacteroidota bacterium]
MRVINLIFIALIFLGCGRPEVYHTMVDVNDFWESGSPAQFEFSIQDTSRCYDIRFEIRNSSDYPWARFYSAYLLKDSVGNRLDSLLTEQYLFNATTGEPAGKSAIGGIFEHDLSLRQCFKFPYQGKYKAEVFQMMRADTLTGILSAGLKITPALNQ